MPKQYEKLDNKQLKIIETVPQETVVSYDKILNDIQEHEAKLVELNALKDEVEKLNLKR